MWLVAASIIMHAAAVLATSGIPTSKGPNPIPSTPQTLNPQPQALNPQPFRHLHVF